MRVCKSYLFVFGLFLSCGCTDTTPFACKVKCRNQLEWPSEYKIDRTRVTQNLIECNLTASSSIYNTCLLDITRFVPSLTSPAQENHLEVHCTTLTRLVLGNSSSSVVVKNAISRLKFRGLCKLSFTDVEKLGIVTNVEALRMYGNATIEHEGSANRPQRLKGAWNVSSVGFVDQPFENFFPKAFTQSVWTTMAGLVFENVDVENIPMQILRKTMPNLQFLDLTHSRLTKPPQFPWSSSLLRFPRNQKRRNPLEEVEDDIVERYLALSYNNITDLSAHNFSGLLNMLLLRGNGLRIVGSTSFHHLSGMRFLDLGENRLRNFPARIFQGLETLIELRLDQNDIKHISTDVFMDLPNLKVLRLEHNQLTEVPVSMDLPNLKVLRLTHNQLTEVPVSLDLTNLKVLRLAYNQLTEFPISMDLANLEKLYLAHNQLTEVPVLMDLPNLKVLDLAHNQLTEVPVSMDLANLEKLYLAHNQLTEVPVSMDLPNLKVLHLAHNQLTKVPVLMDLANLETLYLAHNQLTEVPVWVLLSKSLVEIDLSHNNITFQNFISVLESLDWDFFRNQHNEKLTLKIGRKKWLNLVNNNFDTFGITELNETTLSKFYDVLQVYNIDLDGNPLVCDCKLFETQKWLLEQIKENDAIEESNFDTWRCAVPPNVSGTRLIDVQEELFMCQVQLPRCPRNCTCYERPVDDVIYVDCRGLNFTSIPEELPRSLLELHFENNQIGTLPSFAFLENITSLNLSHNNIQELNKSTVLRLTQVRDLRFDNNKLTKLPRAIQNIPFTRLDVQKNNFYCDCEAKWMKYWLRNETSGRIVDTKSIRCNTGIAEGKPVIEVEDRDFGCKEKPGEISPFHEKTIFETLAYIFVALLVLTIVISAFTYKFRGEMKVFMFTHFDWHPFDRLDDSDSTKIYDAFVSYSGHDHTWVWNTLAEKLETRDPPYKLCIHDRDFEVGAPIAENILNSVEQSKRTIMVLSRNFMSSEWCILEFRAAHRRVLKERMRYLIVILLEDMKSEELDSEIQLYMRTNTYLNVDDKWFWQKLFYAMPQKEKVEEESNYPSGITIKSCDGENSNVAESLEIGVDNTSCTVERKTVA